MPRENAHPTIRKLQEVLWVFGHVGGCVETKIEADAQITEFAKDVATLRQQFEILKKLFDEYEVQAMEFALSGAPRDMTMRRKK